MTTILFDQNEREVTRAKPGAGLWLGADDVAGITGFSLKPEGLCKGEICVPVRGRDFVDGEGRIDLDGFWRFLGSPIVQDDAGEIFALGTGAEARTATLASLEAPDFTLPDADGVLHALSELRGRKVFLVTWASW